MRRWWLAIAVASFATRAFAHDVTAPVIVEEPHAEWPNGKSEEHDVVVPVEIKVGADGSPTDVTIEASLGPEFDAIAIATAKRFRFKPATINGEPAASKVRGVVRFPGKAHAEEHAHNVPHHHDDVEPEVPHHADHHHEHEDDVHVQGERPDLEAASRAHVSGVELELRPKFRPADILEATPGLFAVQHAGGGKANQYFLRGFDADHGTDIALFVDGVPVNMPNHGHGQGFTDVHFLIPELVRSLDAYKGPYYAEFGNFATAGALHMETHEELEESRGSITVGPYGVVRGLVIEAPKLAEDWHAIIAAEGAHQDGPFKNKEDLARFNVFGRLTHDFSDHAKASLTWMSYGSKWNGSGQIPARAVCGEGELQNPAPPPGQCIDRFGFIDPSEGGDTQRHQLSLRYLGTYENMELEALAYLVRYRFTLYSNFTFFADDPVRGDEIEQNDDRITSGGSFRITRKHRYAGLDFASTLGFQARVDTVGNALSHDQARTRIEDRVIAQITESDLGIYAREDMRAGKWLRLVAGARVDRFDANVDGRVGAESGTKGATPFSPKLMGVVSPSKWLDLYASYGRGFHSNDARGAVLRIDPATYVTMASGYEVGARVSPNKELSFSAAGFLLDLDSELVWSGDEGTTEPSGRTRRYGVDLGARWQHKNEIFADLDATFSQAQFRDAPENAREVPLAPRITFSAGIAAKKKLGDFTPFGAVRFKAIADRPATEDGSLTADGFAIVDANAGVRWKRFELAVDAQNLFNAKWREVSFATTSRLPWEPNSVTGIHYTAGWPITVMGRATVYW